MDMLTSTTEPEIVPPQFRARPRISVQYVAEVVNEIAADYRVHPNDIFGRSRNARIVAARHAYIATIMREYKLAITHAAEYFQLDRSTIRNAIRKNLRREAEAEVALANHNT